MAARTLTLVRAGASAALMQTAAALVSKAVGGRSGGSSSIITRVADAATDDVVPVANARAADKDTSAAAATTTDAAADAGVVVVGTAAPRGVYACVAEPPSSRACAPYDGVRTAVVRAVLPRQPSDQLQLRDVLDVYPAAGIACDEEQQRAREAFARASEVAAAAAAQRAASRVTLVVKPVSKHKQLNELFLRTCSATLEAAGLSVDVLHTAQAANELLLFPERHAVVLVNDEATCERILYAYAGVTGGAATRFCADNGATLYGGHSTRAVARALAATLHSLGMTAEAKRIAALADAGDVRGVAAAA